MPFDPNELEWNIYNDANLAKVPAKNGIYLLSCPKGEVIYVGKAASNNLDKRLRSYGTKRNHNKWLRTYFSLKSKVLPHFNLPPPHDLFFMFRLTEHAAEAEAVAIQRFRSTIEGFNQRNEWKPLLHPSDECYQIIIDTLRRHLPADQRVVLDAKIAAESGDD